jgi:hypothetical protein
MSVHFAPATPFALYWMRYWSARMTLPSGPFSAGLTLVRRIPAGWGLIGIGGVLS